ncbi:MAG: chromate transporter [Bacteroidales bacterium]|nr:chromate transporter [Bacteroidales bacterium]
MIFWQLFYTFCKIGIFNFGGGYAMIALIQNEVVEKHAWMTIQEFTDIVAISQMTPGPIGINVATYAGYTAVVNAGYAPWIGSLSAVMSSFAVILLPCLLMLMVCRYLLAHRDNKIIDSIFSVLRPAIVGVIAAAALLLASKENFGDPTENGIQFGISIVIFAAVFVASYRHRRSPILLLLLSGLVGAIVYLGFGV